MELNRMKRGVELYIVNKLPLKNQMIGIFLIFLHRLKLNPIGFFIGIMRKTEIKVKNIIN